MHIPRIYLNQEISINTEITLPKETALHITTVLKKRSGQNIIIFNNKPDLNNSNQYGEYLAEILTASKNNLTIKIIQYNIKNTQSRIILELAQCISKPQHFDVTLQKSVELGVNIITPIISERSEQSYVAQKLDQKYSRWERIIISACEQSGRTDLPVLNQPIILTDWVKKLQINNNLLITLCTKTNKKLSNLKINQTELHKITALIGPEGGLSDVEINLLNNNNFNLISLGNRILRTETAGIAIMAILQYVMGNL
ncbi:MAG: 16S rRNA (uracil(1498)-N(3))-methyltransferase [Gammaproteobacteria bacterium]|nr:16S rRNA (uracil(1498)-N(3))-methyltransferase [Gammaproteobacteria bacterium]